MNHFMSESFPVYLYYIPLHFIYLSIYIYSSNFEKNPENLHIFCCFGSGYLCRPPADR